MVGLYLSDKARRTGEQPINYFVQQAVENPRLISLAAGLVDSGSLPTAETAAALQDVLSDPDQARAALQYGTAQGYGPLRERLVQRTVALDGLTPTDLNLSASDVVVTTGSQQLLYILTEVLLDPGDIVITEAPSYCVYHGTLASLGTRTLSVPCDDDGMDTGALEELLKRLERTGELDRVRLIYTVDYFQNPGGFTLSLPRRQKLLELAQHYSRQHRILILEDAAYRELHYEDTDVPSIKSLDRDNAWVALAMTFSKPCAPGLKTGFGILPPGVMKPLLRLKANHDFGSNNLTQHLLDRLLETGAYDRHVCELRHVYRRKCECALAALEREFGHVNGSSAVRWNRPAGGMYVWVSFPSDLDTGPQSPMMQACLREGVLYVPGEFCYVDDDPRGRPTWEARLSFGVVTPEQLAEGIGRLARAYRSVYEASSQRAVLSTRS